ncbi:MAG: hypothetical protein LAT58_07475 [Opitutales bacterium]|nr:hypothetical protein [Opitutales bacterium]
MEDNERFEDKFDKWLKTNPSALDKVGLGISPDRLLWQEKMRLWSLRAGGALSAAAAVWALVLFLNGPPAPYGNGMAAGDEQESQEAFWSAEEESWANFFILEDQLAGMDWQPDEEDEILAHLLFNGS